MRAVILAGARLDLGFAAEIGTEWRCELPFRGKTLLDHTLDALRDFAEPVVVGGPPRHDVCWREGGSTFLDSLGIGLEEGGSGSCLLSSSDLPFLSRAAVSGFLARCGEGAAIHYPIVNLRAMEAAYPGMRRTAMRLREGTFTGGNLFHVDVEVMRALMPKMQAAYNARKSPLQLARVLGMSTIWAVLKARVAPSWTSVSEMEQRVGRAIGARVRAVDCPYPEIAADIDDSEQFAWLQSL